jgi:hypothetical protein
VPSVLNEVQLPLPLLALREVDEAFVLESSNDYCGGDAQFAGETGDPFLTMVVSN